MDATAQPVVNAEQFLAAIRAWLADGGADIVAKRMQEAREVGDAIVEDMEVPAQVLDAPVTY